MSVPAKKGIRVRICRIQLLSVAFAMFAALLVGVRPASAVPAQPLVTGTYQILSATPAAGNRMAVKIQIHLSNLSGGSLFVTAIGATHQQPRAFAQRVGLHIAAQSAADSTQEFTVPRGKYEQWLNGGRMLLHLSTALSKGRTGILVPLTLVPTGGVK